MPAISGGSSRSYRAGGSSGGNRGGFQASPRGAGRGGKGLVSPIPYSLLPIPSERGSRTDFLKEQSMSFDLTLFPRAGRPPLERQEFLDFFDNEKLHHHDGDSVNYSN